MRLKREGGISLEMPQQKRASFRIERIFWLFLSCDRKLGFLSSYEGDLRDPLEVPQESQVSM